MQLKTVNLNIFCLKECEYFSVGDNNIFSTCDLFSWANCAGVGPWIIPGRRRGLPYFKTFKMKYRVLISMLNNE